MRAAASAGTWSGSDHRHQRGSFIARSTRPFTFSRSDLLTQPFLAFETRVTGGSTVSGSGDGWNFSTPAGVPTYCWWSSSDSGSANVSGRVWLKGDNPARVLLDVGGTGTGSTTTVNVCQPGSSSSLTQPFAISGHNKVWLRRFDLRKAFGHAFTLKDTQVYTNVPSTRTTNRWTLNFVPVKEEPKRERWRVEVSGTEKWTWGRLAKLGAGVWVDWTHRTDLELTDGKITATTGRILVRGVRPISDPPGVFTVTSKPTVQGPYEIPLRNVAKRGRRVTLNLLHEPAPKKASRSTYRVDFTVRIVPGQQTIDRMRAAGVPNPEAVYNDLANGEPVDVYARSQVPDHSRVVFLLDPKPQRRETQTFAEQLPCTIFGADINECFRTRGGEDIAVSRLR